jgi:purine-binding chemotaxis protein CheW
LEFRLAQEHYALETRFVREVQPLRDLTRLPCTPHFVLGIVNIRGRIVPVLDLRKFLDLPEKGLADLHCVILVQSGDIELGLLADVIVGIRPLPIRSLEAALSTLAGVRADFIIGVTDERLIVLNLKNILSDPKILVHEEVEV